MDPLRFWPEAPLVADASVWINIVCGGRASEILRALDAPLIIPRIALDELQRGRNKGRIAAEGVAALIDAGLVAVEDLSAPSEEIYLGLVAGAVSHTLDDGEAATLALALELRATALIDERKALRIAAARFPDLRTATTTDLLLSDRIRSALPACDLVEAVFASLTTARMRVPDHLIEEVCTCLGEDRVRLCISLPARVRKY